MVPDDIVIFLLYHYKYPQSGLQNAFTTVGNGGEVDTAGGYIKFRYVSEPSGVRRVCMEITLGQISHSQLRFSQIPSR